VTVIFSHFGRRTGTTAKLKEKERGRLGEQDNGRLKLLPFILSPLHPLVPIVLQPS
jgi:hypothetical protein